MKQDAKRKLEKAVISILSILLVILTACLLVFIHKTKEANTLNLDSQKKYEDFSKSQESALNEVQSDNESLKNEISEKESNFNQEKEGFEKKISDLQKQLALKAAVAATSKSVATAGKKTVYLTFDDGPSERTPEVLAILKQNNIKATFFVINGKSANHYMKDIVQQGHTIALHTYTHNYQEVYASEDAFFKDLNSISDLVYEQTGIRSKLMRFPGGSSNTVSRKYSKGIMTRLTKKVTEQGYTYFDWNISSGDATSPTPSAAKIVENCKRVPKSNAVIVLFHDSKAKKSTVEALPMVIAHYKSLGYSFAALTKDTPPAHQRVAN